MKTSSIAFIGSLTAHVRSLLPQKAQKKLLPFMAPMWQTRERRAGGVTAAGSRRRRFRFRLFTERLEIPTAKTMGTGHGTDATRGGRELFSQTASRKTSPTLAGRCEFTAASIEQKQAAVHVCHLERVPVHAADRRDPPTWTVKLDSVDKSD
ncbi:hypothetical protein EVAR_82820_1 [Eumeta japonica]|uniref:Uncharacterized protein n=1 Tax=Eumeta variegata TaxID=151549 RepID=A0A4C1V2E9_EUMVA|nr:hypothetical protein EVAR_82820_1 [Eumeta japonica]